MPETLGGEEQSFEQSVIKLVPTDPIDRLLLKFKAEILEQRTIGSERQKELVVATQAGDEKAANELVYKHIGLVAAIAYPFKGHGVTSKNLLTIGKVSTLVASMTYSLSSDLDFSDHIATVVQRRYCEAIPKAGISPLEPSVQPMKSVYAFMEAAVLKLDFNLRHPISGYSWRPSAKLKRGFELSYPISGYCGAELIYTSEATRWKLMCKKLADSATYPSRNPLTKRVKVLFQLVDQATKPGEEISYFYGLYTDNTVRRFTITQKDLLGYEPLFSHEDKDPRKKYGLSEKIKVTSPSSDEIRRLDALVNLGLPEGLDPSSTWPEEVTYKNELAATMGSLCLQAVEESAQVQERSGYLELTLASGHDLITITQRTTPAVNFPGATLLERYIATISHTPRAPINQEDLAPKSETKQFVLLEDGEIIKLRIIKDSTNEVSKYSDLHSFPRLPSGYYSPVIETASAKELKPILEIIKKELGPGIDWKHVSIQTVLDAAKTSLGLDPRAFGSETKNYKASGNEISKRGLAFMLLVRKGVASLEDISDYTSLQRFNVVREIKNTQDLFDGKSSRKLVGLPPPRQSYQALLRALPRKTA